MERNRRAERRAQGAKMKAEHTANRLDNIARAIGWVNCVWHDYRFPDRGTIFRYRAIQQSKKMHLTNVK